MGKKRTMTRLAVAAVAIFVFVPVASASPVLTEGGKLLPAGASITGKNTGKLSFTGGFSIDCEVAHLQGTVTKNTGSEVEWTVPVGGATISNAGGAGCSSVYGAIIYTVTSELCVRSIPKTDELSMTGCSGNPITFDWLVGAITCRYSAKEWKGKYTTNSTPATMNIAGQPVSEEEPRVFFCPDEGLIDLDFDLHTTDGTAVTIS